MDARTDRLNRKIELVDKRAALRLKLRRLDDSQKQLDIDRRALVAQIAEVEAELLDEPSPQATHQQPPVEGPATGEEIRQGKRAPTQDAIIAFILRKPDATYDDLAMELRGNTSQRAHEAARSMVSKMKRAGRLAGKPGRWTIPKSTKGISEDEQE